MEETNNLRNNVYKWRNNNREIYNQYQRNYHNKRMKEDEEYKKMFNERCRINNKKRYDKMRDESGVKKSRGRPKKIRPAVVINNIPCETIESV